MRVGYMVLPPALSEQFRREVGFYSCTVPVFEQYVLAELIGSGDFDATSTAFAASGAKMSGGRDGFAAAFKKFGKLLDE